jgi:hypothetical protein
MHPGDMIIVPLDTERVRAWSSVPFTVERELILSIQSTQGGMQDLRR